MSQLIVKKLKSAKSKRRTDILYDSMPSAIFYKLAVIPFLYGFNKDGQPLRIKRVGLGSVVKS
jgi:hypothetical protein